MERPQKRQKLDTDFTEVESPIDEYDGEPTEFKLAILSSLHPERSENVLLDYLLAYDGSVKAVLEALSAPEKNDSSPRKNAINGYQSSLSSFTKASDASNAGSSPAKLLTKKGQTLHLYSPEDIEKHTPCSLIHNFLPTDQADAILHELLEEVSSFRRDKFQMFDRAVESPHTSRLYVDSWDEMDQHKTQYMYNGGYVNDVGKTAKEMLKVSGLVREAVNKEIIRRTKTFNPGGRKMKFQSPGEWQPNASFVNCYDGGKESVGWHSDHLTYLGPRAVIGSLSLGVAREFRVRKIVPQVDAAAADEQGQIAIHLPHNSLLVMHADMQEEWKHSISPARSIDPHPIGGNKRLNITYRCYQDYLHPKYTPRCRCEMAAVLRCVQKRVNTRGRYMWMCTPLLVMDRPNCKITNRLAQVMLGSALANLPVLGSNGPSSTKTASLHG